MSTQPEATAAPRPIAPIHPDTITFEAALADFKVGQRISYEALAAMVRKDMRKQGAAVKAHVRSAENRLNNRYGFVFASYHDQDTDERGRVRLDSHGIVDKGRHNAGRIARASKRLERLMACADFDELTEDERLVQATVSVAARGAQRFMNKHGQNRLAKLITNSKERIPELDTAWKALQNGY